MTIELLQTLILYSSTGFGVTETKMTALLRLAKPLAAWADIVTALP